MNQTNYSRIACAVLAFALPVTILADLTNTVTLPFGTTLDLDTGATASSGGDILWNGSQISFQGKALGGVISVSGGAAVYGELNQSSLTSLVSLGSNTAILSASLPAGAVFGVLTNGGNVAKLLVTNNNGGSITLQYDTYGASGSGPSGPTITSVLNNSSVIPAGFPNSGVAPSSLIVILGSGLANPGTPVLQNTQQAGGLPSTLNGASVSVTVGGVTEQLPIYYTCSGALGAANGCGPTAQAASQIAAVLPAATATGTGTITVTYNNANATAPIQVVPSALGFDVYNGSGLAQDASTYRILSYTQSGTPGETILLWGTGLGTDPNDSDTTYTSTPNAINVPLQVYIGGVQANIVYQGASVYPGVDVIGLTIPASAPTGCYVSVAGVVGSVVSNVVTIPIAAGGGPCSDPELGINGSQISSVGSQSTVSYGLVYVIQGTTPSTTGSGTTVTSNAGATFEQITGTSYESGQASLGNCSLTESILSTTAPTVTYLDAGTITVTGPSGSPIPLSTLPGFAGLYEAQLAAGAIPSSGGSFIFNGSGGTQVGPFTATVNFPNPLLTWTNESAATTVNRSQGLTVTWNGGAAGSYVTITGSSTSSTAAGSYTCRAPVSALQFTVPPYVLLGMPAGSGTTAVGNNTSIGSFSPSAPTISVGTTLGSVSYTSNSTYQ